MHLLPSKPIHLFLYSCMFLLFQSTIKAQPSPILNICDSAGNYTSGSTYGSNLYSLLSSLTTNAPSLNGYYNTSSGQYPDQIFGIAQCRGDVSSNDCGVCLDTSMVEIIRRCPNKKQAAIRFDTCLLSYSNQSFFFQLENDLVVYIFNVQNASDPVLFNERLAALMKNLTYTAASEPSASQFATGSTNVSDFTNIYGLVQCNRDLLKHDCLSCLQSMISWIPICCAGKIGGQVASMSCNIRFEVSPFFAQQSRPLLRQPVAAPPPPVLVPLRPDEDPISSNTTNSDVNGGNRSRVIIYVSVASVLGLAIFGCCIYCYLRGRKRPHREKEEGHQALFHYLGPPVGTELMESSMDGEQTQELPLIDLVTIQAATNNFSDENKLGEGGFGPVYKGKLSDGKEIAVKRLSRSSGQGLEEFKNEVTLIAKLQHRNLVRLLYCCIERGEKLLIYEYMPNTSLDVFIFGLDPLSLLPTSEFHHTQKHTNLNKRSQLGWERRQAIVCGIAKGLVYLHEDSRLRIIHRDMKASNVLLDHEMNPKISDFGMARFLGGNQSQINTNRVVGTYGYMAPEYAMGGLFSVKSDVYSFGVLLLEIVSGKRNNSLHLPRHAHSLLASAWGLWCEGKALELIDPLLANSCSTSEVFRWIHIGLLCVQEDAADRPTMSSIILMLGSESMTLPQPTQPGFFVARVVAESDKSSASPKICSNNELTISTLEPR